MRGEKVNMWFIVSCNLLIESVLSGLLMDRAIKNHRVTVKESTYVKNKEK
jgi:hypothetical protein